MKKWLSFLFYCPILICAATGPQYVVKDFSYLYKMKGFDKDLIEMHLTLYSGYVKNTNLILSQLDSIAQKGTDSSPEYGALKKVFPWEYNGMLLHEYYFHNLGGSGIPPKQGRLFTQLVQDFGSFDQWKKDFIATGVIRGIGWSILYYDHEAKKTLNVWIHEHDLGHLAGKTPLLIMDAFEHAYITQFGLDRLKYIRLFFDNINWEVVETRFAQALSSPIILEKESANTGKIIYN